MRLIKLIAVLLMWLSQLGIVCNFADRMEKQDSDRLVFVALMEIAAAVFIAYLIQEIC